jgi:flagellum-specific ATP synthase
VLSRALAEQGHYPAIDVEASISRVMPSVVNAEHLAKAQLFKRVYSRYQQNRDLISVGAYTVGADKDIDFAIERMPHLRQFLQQGLSENIALDTAVERLGKAITPLSRTMPGNNIGNANVTTLQPRTLGGSERNISATSKAS